MEHIVILLVDLGQNHVYVPLFVVELETLAPSQAIFDTLTHLISTPTWERLVGLGSYLGDIDFPFVFDSIVVASSTIMLLFED
jgi:hypothetical protein